MIRLALKELLNRLDAISEIDGDVTDTEVRERIVGAIYNGFFVQTPGYVLPDDYSLYKVPECNGQVREALARFIAQATKTASATPEQRLIEFQDETVESDAGHDFNWYFATADSLNDLAGFQE